MVTQENLMWLSLIFLTRPNALMTHFSGPTISPRASSKQLSGLTSVATMASSSTLTNLYLGLTLLNLPASKSPPTNVQPCKKYLDFRLPWLLIGCEVSGPCHVAYGEPQGSILGPALFNIYINDLPAVPNLCSLKSYVDDSQLYSIFLSRRQPWL